MAGYIGSKASVVSNGAERKKVFDITTTTTSLTGCSYTPNQVHVFHNGVRLVDGTDYTATDGSTVTLTTAAQGGDEVVVVSYATFQPADAYTKTESDGRFVNVTGDTMTGALTVEASGSASSGSLNINATDPFIRFYDSNGATDARKWDIRAVGNSEGLVVRTVNDANTSFVTRLAVDPSGRVTMPYQAAFSAYKNGNQALAAHTPTKITGFSTIFENQSGWNSSTNRYTAPVAGVYLIHFCIQSSVTGGLHVRVDRNGSNGWNGDSYLDYGDTSGGDNTYFAKLNANDYLEFYAYLTSAGNVNANRTRISVVLLG